MPVKPSRFPRTGSCEWCGLHSNVLRGPHQSPQVDGPEGRLLRCNACYLFLYRNGAERPATLIEQSAYKGT